MIMWTTQLQAAELAGAPRLERLLDTWRSARHDSTTAYESWCSGETRGERQLRYAGVVAAMDQEEAAEREVLRALGLTREHPPRAAEVRV
jgi:hypothetical protein